MPSESIESSLGELLGDGLDLVQASLGDDPRPEDLEGVAPARSVDLADLVVQGLSEGVRLCRTPTS